MWGVRRKYGRVYTSVDLSLYLAVAGSDYCGEGGSKAEKRVKWQSIRVIFSSLAPMQKSLASIDILVQDVSQNQIYLIPLVQPWVDRYPI